MAASRFRFTAACPVLPVTGREGGRAEDIRCVYVRVSARTLVSCGLCFLSHEEADDSLMSRFSDAKWLWLTSTCSVRCEFPVCVCPRALEPCPDRFREAFSNSVIPLRVLF